MASSEDLKHMVSSFRVTELQVLLGFAGRNKSGRKHELQQRALMLLEKGCSTPIQIKIKELYRRRFPRRMVVPAGPSSNPPSSYLTHLVSDQRHSTSGASSYSSSPMQGVSKPPPPLPSMSNSLHAHGFSRTSQLDSYNTGLPQMARTSIVIHPDVHYKSLPFYDQLAELVKPTSLSDPNTTKFGDVHRTLYFHLMPSQIQQIMETKNTQNMHFVVQMQLRFCLAETSCLQEDRIPTSLTVKVNGKICSLPPCYPQNKPGVEAKRPGRPINITSLVRLLPSASNQIEIQSVPELGRSYCATVHLVRQVTSEDLLSRLKARNIRNPDHSRASIKEKLAHDPDSEIATTSLRVSLVCPLGKMRMQLPCRALTCTHLQCFDASLYLKMNERKPTWVCPVCDKTAPFEQLSIDGLFMEILETPPESNEIQFLEDGSWRPMEVEVKKEPHFLSPSTPCDGSSINLDLSPSDASTSEPIQRLPSKNQPITIDLTLSSDSESEIEDGDIDKKFPHGGGALNFDMDQEIQRDLLQTPPVEAQLSPSTSISDTPSITAGSPIYPGSPHPATGPPSAHAGQLSDALDQDFPRAESGRLPYPCSPVQDYHHHRSVTEPPQPHRRMIPSPHHSMFADMSPQASAPPMSAPQVIPDYYQPFNYAPALPQLSNADIGDLFSLLSQEMPMQQMGWEHPHHRSSHPQRSPGRPNGPQDVIPLD